MTIPPWGRFDYYAVVPGGQVLPNEPPWNMQGRDGKCDDDPGLQARLLGRSPLLEICDGGPTPSPNAKRPAMPRVRFTLKAATEDSTVHSASFFADQSLMRYFAAGDCLQIVRTGMGDLGLSLLRGDELIFALGAVSHVSLGRDIRVTTPWDLAEKMAAILRTRAPQFGLSPVGDSFRELPIEINIHGHNRIPYSGEIETGNYDLWLEHGQLTGINNARHEAVAIWHKELCGRATIVAQVVRD